MGTARKTGGQESRGRELGASKGCLRVCETVGVLEEEEKALDPSLTCVTLAVTSPLWVCFPSGKMGVYRMASKIPSVL